MSTISFFGYDDCVALENESTRVVLCPHGGGRVLEYALHGQNAIYTASRIDANLEAPTADTSPQVRPARHQRRVPRYHVTRRLRAGGVEAAAGGERRWAGGRACGWTFRYRS